MDTQKRMEEKMRENSESKLKRENGDGVSRGKKPQKGKGDEIM